MVHHPEWYCCILYDDTIWIVQKLSHTKFANSKPKFIIPASKVKQISFEFEKITVKYDETECLELGFVMDILDPNPIRKIIFKKPVKYLENDPNLPFRTTLCQDNLIHICSYLSIKGLVSLSMLSKWFYDFIYSESKLWQWRRFDVKSLETEKITVGNYIIMKNSTEIELLLQRLQGIGAIHFCDLEHYHYISSIFAIPNVNMEVLTWKLCHRDDSFCLTSLPNLRFLRIELSMANTSDYSDAADVLPKLCSSKMEFLILDHDLYDENLRHLVDFANRNPNLKGLDIRSRSRVEKFYPILEQLHFLKILVFRKENSGRDLVTLWKRFPHIEAIFTSE